MKASVRIGNGAGFFGDTLDAPRFLVEGGKLDYLTLEYLAELTLSILAHQKSRNPELGYAGDFPTTVAALLPVLRSQPELKIVTNAGGMNPQACARKISEILNATGDRALSELRVASVSGDDLLPQLDEYICHGEKFVNLDTGKPLGELRAQVASANAYLGAGGIVDALAAGARIVLTGRVADASLTLGPAIHELGWSWDDWPRLAAATVAGHIIECGAQATGGMFADWTPEMNLAEVGYPIAEIAREGGVVISKPPGSGGCVDIRTVSEQLVYEIGDPEHYLTPDIDTDFSQVRLAQVGKDLVSVSGARGGPPPATYKVSLAHRDGYMASGTLVVVGRDAEARARHCGEMILARVRRGGFQLARTNIECLGAGDVLPGVSPRAAQPPEVVLRVTVHDPAREGVERFVREFAPLVTSGPPGVTGYTGPRAKPYPVLAYWPTTIERTRVRPIVEVHAAAEWLTKER